MKSKKRDTHCKHIPTVRTDLGVDDGGYRVQCVMCTNCKLHWVEVEIYENEYKV